MVEENVDCYEASEIGRCGHIVRVRIPKTTSIVDACFEVSVLKDLLCPGCAMSE